MFNNCKVYKFGTIIRAVPKCISDTYSYVYGYTLVSFNGAMYLYCLDASGKAAMFQNAYCLIDLKSVSCYTGYDDINSEPIFENDTIYDQTAKEYCIVKWGGDEFVANYTVKGFSTPLSYIADFCTASAHTLVKCYEPEKECPQVKQDTNNKNANPILKETRNDNHKCDCSVNCQECKRFHEELGRDKDDKENNVSVKDNNVPNPDNVTTNDTVANHAGHVTKVRAVKRPSKHKEYIIPVSFESCGFVKVLATSAQEAIDIVSESVDDFELPDFSDYVDGSFSVTTDDPDIIEAYSKDYRDGKIKI